jgi:hypothetical protein
MIRVRAAGFKLESSRCYTSQVSLWNDFGKGAVCVFLFPPLPFHRSELNEHKTRSWPFIPVRSKSRDKFLPFFCVSVLSPISFPPNSFPPVARRKIKRAKTDDRPRFRCRVWSQPSSGLGPHRPQAWTSQKRGRNTVTWWN